MKNGFIFTLLDMRTDAKGLCNEIPENGKRAKMGSYLASPDYRFPELRCKADAKVLEPGENACNRLNRPAN
ncbi:MAG TPA: hypothetical protein VH575_23330 [Gemmataceae bacterium]|jgi:hypothetical protein